MGRDAAGARQPQARHAALRLGGGGAEADGEDPAPGGGSKGRGAARCGEEAMTRPAREAGRPSQSGQAMVEYLIVFPSLLLVILGAVQFALLYHVKNTLQYATFAAARQGSLKNAQMNSIKDA